MSWFLPPLKPPWLRLNQDPYDLIVYLGNILLVYDRHEETEKWHGAEYRWACLWLSHVNIPPETVCIICDPSDFSSRNVPHGAGIRPGIQIPGLWLVNTGHVTWVLASDWSMLAFRTPDGTNLAHEPRNDHLMRNAGQECVWPFGICFDSRVQYFARKSKLTTLYFKCISNKKQQIDNEGVSLPNMIIWKYPDCPEI